MWNFLKDWEERAWFQLRTCAFDRFCQFFFLFFFFFFFVHLFKSYGMALRTFVAKLEFWYQWLVFLSQTSYGNNEFALDYLLLCSINCMYFLPTLLLFKTLTHFDGSTRLPLEASDTIWHLKLLILHLAMTCFPLLFSKSSSSARKDPEIDEGNSITCYTN